MAINPCICGISLQSGTKILAIFDMICAAIFGIAFITIFTLAMVAISTEKPDKSALGILIAIGVLAILVFVAQFILGLVLLQGSNQRNLQKCRIWFVITLVLLVLNIISFISSLISRREGQNPAGTGGSGFSIAYHFYALWVVYAFMEELKGSPVPTSEPA